MPTHRKKAHNKWQMTDRFGRLPFAAFMDGLRGRLAADRRPLIAMAGLMVLIVAAFILARTPRNDVPAAPPPTVSPEVTQAPTPSPTPPPAHVRFQVNPVDEVRPDRDIWQYRCGVFAGGKRVEGPLPVDPIRFEEGSRYTELQGIVTFRGDNFRQNAAYGTAKLENTGFRQLWSVKIGAIDSGYAVWSGVGWTGQPVMVRWPDALRRSMNLREEYREKDGMVEVIYGTLDGNIYFMDLETGEFTRNPLHLGFPIKGSVSIDPRGYPLLYVGQGISTANGKRGKIGWRIYSLLDQGELFFLNGHDKASPRDHGAFDGSCIVHAGSDVVLQGGENGLMYAVRLNAAFDIDAPSVAVSPQVAAYRYSSAASPELGIENSVAAYGRYIWFADNSGLLTCLDLDTLAPAWLFYVGDDTDASVALDLEDDGTLALYTVNEIDRRGESGKCTVRRIDAATGRQDWQFTIQCQSDGTNGGGGFASPAIGQHTLEDYVYFNICQTGNGGTLLCFEKRTGRVVWRCPTGNSSWSSPVLVYRPDGTGVLVLCTLDRVRAYDPLTGKRLSEARIEGKVEGSPAVFGDILVVGTRSQYIYGIRLT